MKTCSTKYCRNEPAPRRSICHKCKSRREKENNPAFYYYNLLRCNAKRRGKEFILTLTEFKQFCEETNYIQLKGKTSKSMSIDRINSSKGYSIDNIRVLSLSENSKNQNNDNYPF